MQLCELAIDKVKKQMYRKRQSQKCKETSCEGSKSNGLKVSPYVSGRYSRVMKKHNVSIAIRSHTNIHSLLVHCKEKQDLIKFLILHLWNPMQMMYANLYWQNQVTFSSRLAEHRREAEKAGQQKHNKQEGISNSFYELSYLNSELSCLVWNIVRFMIGRMWVQPLLGPVCYILGEDAVFPVASFHQDVMIACCFRGNRYLNWLRVPAHQLRTQWSRNDSVVSSATE